MLQNYTLNKETHTNNITDICKSSYDDDLVSYFQVVASRMIFNLLR